MLLALVRLLRFASLAICAIVVLAFVVFAANETKTASNNQREQIAAVNPSTAAGSQPGAAKGGSHESAIHEALDEASHDLTSPFAGVVSDSSSEWVTRGVRTLLALLVYGFGLGFIARSLRIHL